ncbi:AsmA family protein [Sneathiella sp. P13V-1]|uniref:AsmA family protein n=1 Tax=Sneathiella sp. P13V-1 TaxID=2697366 RepID=UPI00187B7B0D|nr:AsmA family protein [Sneathiella sp. P13V-1]MBE7635543.1 AsmA family protein [Sneathiella sp. P13V-1]
MKKALYAVLILVGLVIAAVIALPFLIPAERLKEELILAVGDATGRTLSIDGELGVSFFPTLGLTASKVSLSNSPQSSKPNMASIDDLTVALNLMPLLSGNVSVDKFILTKPVISLEVDKNGKKNWEFETAAKEEAPKESDATSSDGGSGLGISDLNLGDVRIVDGAISYIDAQNNVTHEVTNANLTLDLRGLDQPFKTEGSADWQGETITLNTEVGALRALLENKSTSVAANVSSTKVTLDFNGEVAKLDPLAVGGKVNLAIPSLKDLTAWVGSPMEAREGTFGPVSIEGNVAVKGTTYSFSDAKMAFDQITGTGSFSADTGGAVPMLTGILDIPALDVNPYLPEGTGEASKPAESAEKPINSDEKWDSTPIDLSGLKAVNADLKLKVQKILVQKVKIDSSQVFANLKNGVLNLRLGELALYEGKGTGEVVLDASSSVAKLSESFNLEGLQLLPFLTDAADFDKLEGTGRFDFAITTSGQSQKDMVEKLNGKGSFLFNDGAINGINLAAMARNVTSAFTDSGGAQKTDFAEFSGSYTITNGLVENSDLKLLNPFIRVTGKGTANMPPKTVDYRVEPKVTASTEGQGGKDAGGLMIPILITGSWEDPKFAPDLAGTIGNVADPKALKENLENVSKEKLKEQLGGGDIKDTLKKGLGGFLGKQ